MLGQLQIFVNSSLCRLLCIHRPEKLTNFSVSTGRRSSPTSLYSQAGEVSTGQRSSPTSLYSQAGEAHQLLCIHRPEKLTNFSVFTGRRSSPTSLYSQAREAHQLLCIHRPEKLTKLTNFSVSTQAQRSSPTSLYSQAREAHQLLCIHRPEKLTNFSVFTGQRSSPTSLYSQAREAHQLLRIHRPEKLTNFSVFTGQRSSPTSLYSQAREAHQLLCIHRPEKLTNFSVSTGLRSSPTSPYPQAGEAHQLLRIHRPEKLTNFSVSTGPEKLTKEDLWKSQPGTRCYSDPNKVQLDPPQASTPPWIKNMENDSSNTPDFHPQLSAQNPLCPVAREDKKQGPVEYCKSRTSVCTDLQKKVGLDWLHPQEACQQHHQAGSDLKPVGKGKERKTQKQATGTPQQTCSEAVTQGRTRRRQPRAACADRLIHGQCCISCQRPK